MQKTIGAFQARQQLDAILKDVATKGDSFVVERNGDPIAALVPIAVHQNWQRERESFFDGVRDIQEHVNLSPQEADQLASESVAAVRERG